MDLLRDSLTRVYPWHDWELKPGGIYKDLVWKGGGAKPTQSAILAAGAVLRDNEAAEQAEERERARAIADDVEARIRTLMAARKAG